MHRTTICFDEEGLKFLKKIAERTHTKSVSDIVRGALRSFDDLMRAESAGYECVLRHQETGKEIRYSPHRPLTLRRAEKPRP